jgi:hypothetical protein
LLLLSTQEDYATTSFKQRHNQLLVLFRLILAQVFLIKMTAVPEDNTGSAVSDSAITNFDFAIGMTCAWLLPKLVAHQRLYHRTLARNPQWVEENVPSDPGPAAAAAARDGYAGGNVKRAAANSVVNWAMAQAMALAAFFFTAVAITLSLLTRDLDYRTSYIQQGISLFVGSFYIYLLSFSAPQWLGVFASLSESRRTDIGHSLATLAIRARLTTLKTFVNIFPIMAPFFCGVLPATIPCSVVVGLLLGFFLCLTIDWGNRTVKNRTQLKIFAYSVAFAMIFLSALLFAVACSYVENVWGDTNNEGITTVSIIGFFSWLVGCVFLHAVVWKATNDKHKQMRMSRQEGSNEDLKASKSIIPRVSKRPHTFFGGSVYKFSQTNLETEPQDAHEGNKDSSNSTQDKMGNIEEGEGSYEEVEQHQQVGPDEEEPQEQPHEIPMEEEQEDGGEEGNATEESTCHFVNAIFCDLTCGAGGKTIPFGAKAYNCCSWFTWFLIFASSLFAIIIMVGAQHQEKAVRANLPRVHEILYGTINEGEMCGFDNRGNMTRREKIEATQRTFKNPDEVEMAGYTVLHCGNCGKCSVYGDLRLQYATRQILSRMSLECAKKGLFGGYQSMVDCIMEKTTFTQPCSECWATDMVCTKKNCIWIGLRGFLINTVTNLQVGPSDITPATCEEAMCEATEITGYEGFVPCSGASRRRMNVTSDIKRPLNQQCTQVPIKWEEFFGPSTGNLDYDSSYDFIVGETLLGESTV